MAAARGIRRSHGLLASGFVRALALVSVAAAGSTLCVGAPQGKPKASASSSALDLGVDYGALAATMDAAEIRRDIEHLSGLGSRALGYAGSDAAVEYVVGRLEGLGYAVRRETFPEVMPIDHGGRLECDQLDKPIPLHALWPNLARTPSTREEGLSGELIYARSGAYRWYDGRQVKDSIVILDFNSTNNYLKAFMLGARAVIFLEPDTPERKEAEAKLIAVPVYAPKYYVQKKHIPTLLDLAAKKKRATIHSNMVWERVLGTNVIVHVDGTEEALRGDSALLVGYFDAMSVAPALCPGADQACGIAVWLQMARLLKSYPPARPVTLLATNAHFPNNAGVKQFLMRHPRYRGDLKRKFYRSILREGKKWVKEQRGAWLLGVDDIADWPSFCARLKAEGAKASPGPGKRIWELLDEEARETLGETEPNERDAASALNEALKQWDFYQEKDFEGVALPDEAKELLDRDRANLSDREIEKLNRLLLEAAYPEEIEKGQEVPLWPPAISGYEDGSQLLRLNEILDWPGLCAKLKTQAGKKIWDLLPEDSQQAVEDVTQGIRLEDARKLSVVKAINEKILKHRDFCQEADFAGGAVPEEAKEILDLDRETLSAWQIQKLNRLLLEARYPDEIAKNVRESAYLNRRFAVCLDLSSHSSTVGVFANGVRGLDEPNQEKIMWPVNNRLREHADVVLGKQAQRVFYSGISESGGVTWDSMLPCDLAFDSRPFLDLRREAAAIATTLDLRLAVDTPLDRAEFVDFDGLTAQGRLIAKVVGGLLYDKRVLPKQKVSLVEFLDWARTRALYLDPKKMTYTGIGEQPVLDALVMLQDFDAQRANPGQDVKIECPLGHTGVRAWGHALTNEDGRACLIFDGPDPSMRKDAYQITPDGRLTMSIDQGLFGTRRVGGTGGVSTSTPTVLFPFHQLEFFETLDVRHMGYAGGIHLLDQNDGFPQRWGGVGNGRSAMIALDPMWQLKLIAGRLGDFSLLLLNTTEDEPMGLGFGPQPDGRIPFSFFQAVKDQERLVRFRRDRMQRRGIRYAFTDDMVDRAAVSLTESFEQLGKLDYSAAMHKLFDATTRAGTAYPLIWNVMTDTIYGLILVFLLVVPFSIFLERLLFGVAELQRRLLLVVAIFICICLILNALHPGFEIATSPYLIPLAFAILTLVLVVLTMMVAKFDRQVAELRDVAARVHNQDVNRMGAAWAAFALGIGNMRRRKTRTALTLITLVLITFSLLSLTSGEISRKFFKVEFDHEPSYPGVMVRERMWGYLSEAAPEVLTTSFSHQATIAPRCWAFRRGGQTLMIPLESNGRSVYAYGMAGFTPEEATVSNINREIEGGRWFKADAGPQCMLPENLAEKLGLDEGDVGKANVRIYGRDFRLIAIFQPGRLQDFKDLDGEQTSPLLPVRTAGSFTQFVHLDMRDVVLASYEDMRNMGAHIMSVAMRFRDPDQGRDAIRDFASRTNALCFVALHDHVEAWSYLGFVWVSGLKDLIIPLAIGMLIVLNTMLNSVYERAREIGIFGAVGLSPIHVSTLFFAESVVYGVLGVMFGYLVGQVSAYLIIKFHFATGLSLNYSSVSAVFVSVMALLLIVVSTMYPAWVAYKMSTPGVERSWRPPAPRGDVWRFDMPFNVPAPIAPGIAAFFYRYFDSYREASVGAFFTDSTSLEKGTSNGSDMAVVRADVWLAPFDAGVKQEVHISFPPDPTDDRVAGVAVRLERLTGTPGDWQRMNKQIFRVLRKQFLVWRTIRHNQREEYMEQGRRVMSGSHRR